MSIQSKHVKLNDTTNFLSIQKRDCAIPSIGVTQAGLTFHDATPLRVEPDDITSCRKLSRLWVLAEWVLPEKPPGSRISRQQREKWIFVLFAVVQYCDGRLTLIIQVFDSSKSTERVVLLRSRDTVRCT